MSRLTRRALIGRAAAGAGAAALPASLVAVPVALAQSDAQTDALERLMELEQAAELAFSLAAEEGDLEAGTSALFEEFTLHCGEHATALSEALDQLGIDPPQSSDDPADFEVLDDFDSAGSEASLLAFVIDLELQVVEAYEDEVFDLDDPDLIRTSAQVAASHAQQLVALRVAAGERNLIELPPASTRATESQPDAPSSDE